MSVWNKRSAEEAFGPRPDVAPARPPAAMPPAAAVPSRSAAESSRNGASIGRTIAIKGEIRGSEDLFVDGRIEGRIDLGQHRLTIGANAQVTASVRAREVEVQGAVNGNVDASDRIIIRKEAKLVGDLKMAGVVIEDGAYFKGSIDISQGKPLPTSGPPVVDKSSDAPVHTKMG